MVVATGRGLAEELRLGPRLSSHTHKATTTLGKTRTTFTKGDPRNKGRPVGSHNKLTRSAREAIEYCAHALGGGQRLYHWCKESKTNERTFWSSIYPRLLPITGHVSAVYAPEPSADAEAVVAEITARLDAIAATREAAAPTGNGHDSNGNAGNTPPDVKKDVCATDIFYGPARVSRRGVATTAARQ